MPFVIKATWGSSRVEPSYATEVRPPMEHRKETVPIMVWGSRERIDAVRFTSRELAYRALDACYPKGRWMTLVRPALIWVRS